MSAMETTIPLLKLVGDLATNTTVYIVVIQMKIVLLIPFGIITP